jgi:hypothetical protein
MSLVNEHNAIIPRDDLRDIGNTTYSPSEKNVETLHTCEASEEGVCCQSDATRVYPTSEGIERHLCDDHFYKLLRLIYAWHLIRREMRGAA